MVQKFFTVKLYLMKEVHQNNYHLKRRKKKRRRRLKRRRRRLKILQKMLPSRLQILVLQVLMRMIILSKSTNSQLLIKMEQKEVQL